MNFIYVCMIYRSLFWIGKYLGQAAEDVPLMMMMMMLWLRELSPLTAEIR